MSSNVDKMGVIVDENTYSLGVPADTNNEPVRTLKRGRICCYVCCDMRRAVIIVNGFMCVFLIVGLVDGLGSRNTILQQIANNTTMYNDDMIEDSTAIETWALEFNVPMFVGMKVLRIFCSIIGIVGAIQYNSYGVGIAALMYASQIVSELIQYSAFPVISVFFLYPHHYFLHENLTGIMTKENYHNEKQSCCCDV